MKIRLIILASLLVVMSGYTCVAQITPKPNGPVNKTPIPNKLPTTLKPPDLIVYWALVGNPDSNNGKVEMRIKNVGTGNADCHTPCLKSRTSPRPARRQPKRAITLRFRPSAQASRRMCLSRPN